MTAVAALVLLSYRGNSRAVFVVGPTRAIVSIVGRNTFVVYDVSY